MDSNPAFSTLSVSVRTAKLLKNWLITTSPEFLAKLEAEERNSGVDPYEDPGEYWRSANPRRYGSAP